MIRTNGVIQHGRVELKEPINLPDGTEVSLAILESRSEINSDEAWDHTPAGVADWLKWYDSLQPLMMTPQEEADAQSWLQHMSARGAAELSQSTAD
jgi:hypothetical protein